MTAKDNTGTKRPLIILTGPTAVGKTALSIGLAKAIQGEIISADSMQVYRGMDIGTAKITKEQMDGVPHHLIDIMDPSDSFHVMAFQQKCKEAMEDIYARHKGFRGKTERFFYQIRELRGMRRREHDRWRIRQIFKRARRVGVNHSGILFPHAPDCGGDFAVRHF